MPIGYLMRLEHGGISIEITVSQHYNVINGRSFVKTGFDSYTNAMVYGKSQINIGK
jgi:hypothetical protein